MSPAVLPLLLSWAAVVVDCHGAPVLHPEQVSYRVPYVVRGMAWSPDCPLDEEGHQQPCARVVDAGEWSSGLLTSLDVDVQENPRVGEVFDVQEPVAVAEWQDSKSRSDGPCP